jgi:hypothetical protein
MQIIKAIVGEWCFEGNKKPLIRGVSHFPETFQEHVLASQIPLDAYKTAS